MRLVTKQSLLLCGLLLSTATIGVGAMQSVDSSVGGKGSGWSGYGGRESGGGWETGNSGGGWDSGASGGWGGGGWEGGRWRWQSNWDQNDSAWEFVPDPAQVMVKPADSTDKKKRKQQEGKALLESLLGDKDASSPSAVSRLSAAEGNTFHPVL